MNPDEQTPLSVTWSEFSHFIEKLQTMRTRQPMPFWLDPVVIPIIGALLTVASETRRLADIMDRVTIEIQNGTTKH